MVLRGLHSYHQARALCQTQPGGDTWLPRVYNEQENDEIGQLVKWNVWLGGDDEEVSISWTTKKCRTSFPLTILEVATLAVLVKKLVAPK